MNGCMACFTKVKLTKNKCKIQLGEHLSSENSNLKTARQNFRIIKRNVRIVLIAFTLTPVLFKRMK